MSYQAARILVVDDESAVRRFIRTCLERKNFQVLEAQSAEEALTLFRENNLDVQLIVSDVRMLGMDGNEFARCIYNLKPAQRILFITAYPGEVEDPANRAETLEKPFSAGPLLKKVAAHLARAASV